MGSTTSLQSGESKWAVWLFIFPTPLGRCCSQLYSLFCLEMVGKHFTLKITFCRKLHLLPEISFGLLLFCFQVCFFPFKSLNPFGFLNSGFLRSQNFLVWLVTKGCCAAWRHQHHQFDIYTSGYRKLSVSSLGLH